MPRRLVFSIAKSAPVPSAASDCTKSLGVRSRIDQRADRHVSADAGEGVQVADLHAITCGSSSPEGPCRNSSMAPVSPLLAMLISTTRAPDDFAIDAPVRRPDRPPPTFRSPETGRPERAAVSASRQTSAGSDLAEPYHAGTQHPAAFAARRKFGKRRPAVLTLAVAIEAAQHPDASVQSQNIAAAGQLMQSVDILGDQREFSGACFELGQSIMAGIGPGLRDERPRRQSYHSQTSFGSRRMRSGVARSSARYCFHNPVPQVSPRNVGTPLSADTPAPVSTAIDEHRAAIGEQPASLLD